MAEKPNAFDNALTQLKIAAEHLKLDQGTLDFLSQPKRIVTVAVPIKTDEGMTHVFTGYLDFLLSFVYNIVSKNIVNI